MCNVIDDLIRQEFQGDRWDYAGSVCHDYYPDNYIVTVPHNSLDFKQKRNAIASGSSRFCDNDMVVSDANIPGK